MLFDVQAALAEILAEPAAQHSPTPVTVPSAPVAERPAPAKVLPFVPPSAPAASRDDEPFRHGASVTGMARTWTGRVVSLDEWRTLSQWDKHGPDGRMFCGACQVWVRPGDCPHCEGGAA